MTIDEINLSILEFSQNIHDVSVLVEENKEILILKLSGTIDTYNSIPLEKLLTSYLDSKYEITIYDLNGVSYMSSTGIGLFTVLLKECKRLKKKMFIMNLQPKVKEVYELLGFLQFFDIIDDISQINTSKSNISNNI